MINTLTTLLAALAVGTIALMLLETDPVRPSVKTLIAAPPAQYDPGELLAQTDVPVQPLNWRDIVIHAAGAEGMAVASRCHFIIERNIADNPVGPGRIRATPLWKRQRHGQHILGTNSAFNDSSVAICLVGDFSSADQAATYGQVNELIALVRSLQLAFGISRGHVYLHRDLDGNSNSPGQAFPAELFETSLLQ